MLGQDMTKPFTPGRKKSVRRVIGFFSSFLNTMMGVFPEEVEADIDYSYYLGPDYLDK